MTSLHRCWSIAVTVALGSGCSCNQGAGTGPPSAVANDSGASSVSVSAHCKDEICLIPAGTFTAGSPLTEPGHGRYSEGLRQVTLTHSFLMGQHEVTRAEWVAAGFPNASDGIVEDDGLHACTAPDCPAAQLTWFEAWAYLNLLSQRAGLEPCVDLVGCSGEVGHDFSCEEARGRTASLYECRGYRLPTITEFQYALRAGTRSAFYSGEFPAGTTSEQASECLPVAHLSAVAWYCANASLTTHAVKGLQPNGWGLFDMLGNVSEFTSSRPEYTATDGVAQTDPNSALSDSLEVAVLGGGANSFPVFLRSASVGLSAGRVGPRRATASVGVGLRIVRTTSQDEAARF